MKKMTMAAVALLLLSFVGCEKTETKPTTYQVVNNMPYNSTGYDYFDGSLYEVVVFHYINDDLSGQENIEKLSYGGGKSDEIEVEDRVEKVKVSFKFLPPASPFYDYDLNDRNYMAAFAYLDKGQKNIITIDGNTMIKGSLKTTGSGIPLSNYYSYFLVFK